MENNVLQMPYTLSKLEIDRISHSLGISFFQAFISHKKKDKTLPKEFYRNYYQSGFDETLEGLIEKGFAIKENVRGLQFYYITPSGINLFRKEFSELVNYKPKKERDLAYLKRRINLCCSFYNYNFGGINADHIIKEYTEKFSKGVYVSHTTKDVINVFKTELKYHLKNN